MSGHADTIRKALECYYRVTGGDGDPSTMASLAALDALVAERDEWEVAAKKISGARNRWKKRAEAAEAEVKRIKDAAQWLVNNRGHRGEEQAWKLLEKALTDE